MEVYKAINKVQGAVAQIGIAKSHKNKQGEGYMFRGIDDVYNTLSSLLAEHGLCILPRVLTRSIAERTSSKGNALFYVTVETELDFVSVSDGSKHTIRAFGEAMDSGDKATSKAQSAAYKAAVLQAFAIPTEGDNDADASTHEVSSPGALAEWLKKITECTTESNLEEIAKELAGMAVGGSDKKALRAAYTQRLKELKS